MKAPRHHLTSYCIGNAGGSHRMRNWQNAADRFSRLCVARGGQMIFNAVL